MDQRSAVSQSNESGSLSKGPVDKQTVNAIEFVASKLRNIGENLNQSYEQPTVSGVRVEKTVPCVLWKDCLGICVLVVKATS